MEVIGSLNNRRCLLGTAMFQVLCFGVRNIVSLSKRAWTRERSCGLENQIHCFLCGLGDPAETHGIDLKWN